MKSDVKVSGPSALYRLRLRQQKGASPSNRHQILNIFIIHIEHKFYVASVLKYYNEVFFNVLHEEIRSIKLFQNIINMV